jgi:2-methylcitrate dehydratase PrpD
MCYKTYPCVYWSHAALDASTNLVREHHIRPEEVKEVIVKSHELRSNLSARSAYSVCEPRNMFEAEMSVPYQIALTFLSIEPGLDWFNASLLNDPTVIELARKVKLIYEPKGDSTIPGMPDCTVELRTSRGVFTNRVKFPLGTPQNQLTDCQLEHKCKNLSSGSVGSGAIDRFLDATYHLEGIEDVRKLTNLLYFTKK